MGGEALKYAEELYRASDKSVREIQSHEGCRAKHPLKNTIFLVQGIVNKRLVEEYFNSLTVAVL